MHLCGQHGVSMNQRMNQAEALVALAAAGVGISDRTFRRLERRGEGPPRTSIGKRCYYTSEGLEAWLAGRTAPRPVAERPEAPRRPRQEASVS